MLLAGSAFVGLVWLVGRSEFWGVGWPVPVDRGYGHLGGGIWPVEPHRMMMRPNRSWCTGSLDVVSYGL